jgi:hypothetical protein
MKIHPVGAELCHAYRQTYDVANRCFAVFVKAPNTESSELSTHMSISVSDDDVPSGMFYTHSRRLGNRSNTT